MKARYLFACVLALAPTAGSAWAQALPETATQTEAGQVTNPPPVRLPDPAAIQVPDVAVGNPERDSQGDVKYSYFHKAGVSFETAVADFAECIAYATMPQTMRLPGSLVLKYEIAPQPGRQVLRASSYRASPYGMVGDVMLAVLMPSLTRRAHQGGMRICMGYKNYRRYPVSKEVYLALNERDPANSIFMQAKLASGPAPTFGSLAP